MKLEKEALIEKVKSYIGEDTSDAAISLLEDVSDSVEGFDGITMEEAERMVAEKEEEWRKKYIERFSGNDEEIDKEETEEENLPDSEEELVSYDELFKED